MPLVVPSDLSQESPFEVDRTPSGDTPRVLENLPGCQYQITSYDADDRSDMDYICMTLIFSSMLGRRNRLACSAAHRTI